MLRYQLYFLLLIFGCNFYAQNYNLTNSFTTKEGLPSNLIYETVLDNDGFLWVATDNGISRFDGKRFINYSTKNGLPSNDVIQVIKQNDGRIWANCYKQPPSYFDKDLNRFVCLEYDRHVLEMSNYLLSAIYSIHKNDLFFQNSFGSFIFSGGKIIEKMKYSQIYKTNDCKKLYFLDEFITIKNTDGVANSKKQVTSNFFLNSKYLGCINFYHLNQWIATYYSNNYIYTFSSKKITQINISSLHPFKYQKISIIIPKTIKWFKFSNARLNITCTDGTVLIYDEKTLKLLSTIKNTFNVNTAYVDHQKNVWISTLNNGLMYYTNQSIKKENFSKDVISNFLCAKIGNDGRIYAGNYQGEIYVKKEGEKEIKYNFSKLKENNLWIRNIHFFPHHIITVSDQGILIDFDKKINFIDRFGNIINIKSSINLNDHELILGSINGLIKFNINTRIYEILNFSGERILNLKRINDTSFYFSGNDGLFKYYVTTHKYHIVISNHLFKNDKIQYFETTMNSDIWVNTYKGNLFLIGNRKIKKAYLKDARIPTNISKLLNIDHQLWMASKSGVYILDYYNLQNASISKLTTSDGLTSNVVNFLDFKKDTIYAATDNGVSKIPYPDIRTNHKINPQIVAVKIDGVIVALDTKYKLKNNQKNISIELAGADITGHFKNFQYSTEGNKFSDIEGNFLNLQLNNGVNTIIVRAIDENNNINTNTVKLIFEIETPYYQKIWFWSLITFAISTVLYVYFNRRKLEKQKIIFEKQIALEYQRNKITADLHDDLGASLSSLQINSAVAQKLFDKNPTEAKKLLKKIEFQAKNISENIGDIIWSLKPSKDEFMSLSTRIKKITSEILGSSAIKYKIIIDESINEEITDFSARKNIILICKEALNNILKHSNSSKAELTITKMPIHYRLKIYDNGVGFTKTENGGNGLYNMKKRAEELGAKLEITVDSGTTIIINIPRFGE